MADFEHARALLRMAHKDFNALTGMIYDPAYGVAPSRERGRGLNIF